jgi:TolB-like protein
MKPTDATHASEGADAAAHWFVRVDSGGEPATDAALAAWLCEQPAHERAMQRVELAVELARRLAADPNSALYAEAVRAASRRRRGVSLMRPLAWGSAAAAVLLLAIFIARDELPPATAPQPAALRAARLVAVNAPSNPVVVLPNGVVVSASAVAVLPFAASGDSTLAHGIERDLVVALRGVPGLYVVGDAAVQAYAGTELSLAEIGTQLGARGIVEAVVELADGRVRVSARLREAATGATLWQADVDRPVDELRDVRDEIAERIATAMLDSGLQADARADSATAMLAAMSNSQP